MARHFVCIQHSEYETTKKENMKFAIKYLLKFVPETLVLICLHFQCVADAH